MTDAIRDNNHVPVALGQSNTDATNTLPFLVDSVTGKLLVDGGGGGGNAWELTGNAGTTPGTNFVGTTDDVDLSFTTDDTERFRLLSTANSGADIVAFEALVDEFQFYGEGESTPFLKRAVSADETTLTSTTGTLTLDTAGAYVESPYFGLSNNTPLQFYNAADANYVGFQVGTLTGNTTYTLPEDYPATSGDVLSSTDAGVMSWITPGGGGGDTLLTQYNFWFRNPDPSVNSEFTKVIGADTNFTFAGTPARFARMQGANSGNDNLLALTVSGLAAVSENIVEVRACTVARFVPPNEHETGKFFWGFSQNSVSSMFTASGFTDLGNTCGFLVEYDTDGYYLKAYSSNAAVSVTKTTINSSTSYQYLKIVFTTLSSLKFYVNGTLVATHTTNIPDDGGADFAFMGWAYTGGGSSSDNADMFISAIDMQVHSV